MPNKIVTQDLENLGNRYTRSNYLYQRSFDKILINKEIHHIFHQDLTDLYLRYSCRSWCKIIVLSVPKFSRSTHISVPCILTKILATRCFTRVMFTL